jgi:hypothetical protein
MCEGTSTALSTKYPGHMLFLHDSRFDRSWISILLAPSLLTGDGQRISSCLGISPGCAHANWAPLALGPRPDSHRHASFEPDSCKKRARVQATGPRVIETRPK